jgi:hypothetical protein
MVDGPGFPPTTFAFEPELCDTSSGQTLFRIEKGLKYTGKFNNREDIDNRFSSIFDRRKVIPTFYCAETIEAAIFESFLRDTPTQSSRVIPKSTFDEQYVVEVTLKVDLKLVSLRGSGLKRLGLMEKELIHCGPKCYVETRAWAESIYSKYPTAQGLIWTSRQLGPDFSMVLFGNRINKRNLKFSGKPLLYFF